MKWQYETGRIYSVDEKNELMAETTFIFIEKNQVDINHTFVNPVLRGQGVASIMLEIFAKYLREQGLKAVASCPYAKSWLQKNKETYSDIISNDFDKAD